jgi:two-component system sensor histidine kinase HydH
MVESRVETDIDLELAPSADRGPGDDRLANRLAWITGLRLGFLTLLLVATAFFYLRGALGVYPQSQGIVFSTIGAAYALAAIYATVLRSGKHLQRLAEAQIVLDQLTWTAIVYVSGGATSGATSFYGLTCLVGAILIGLRGAAMAAVSGIAIFAVLCAGFASKSILPPRDQGAANYVVDWDGMVYPLAVDALGIVVVALLAGYLAERSLPNASRFLDGSPPGSRTRSAIRSDRSPDRSRCSAKARGSPTRTGGSATSSSAKPRASTTSSPT